MKTLPRKTDKMYVYSIAYALVQINKPGIFPGLKSYFFYKIPLITLFT